MATGAIVAGGVLAAAGIAAGVSAAKVKGDKAKQRYYGRSPEQEQAYRQYYGAGMVSGQQQIDSGVGQLQQGTQYAQNIGTRGEAVQGRGLAAADRSAALMDQGSGMLGESYDLQRQAALGNAPSQAEQLLRANADEAARQQMGIASAARGGNQAAAMRNASTVGNQMQLQAGQQAGALRAQEMAQARSSMSQIGAAQSNVGAQRAQLGLGLMDQGFNQQRFSAESQMGAGRYIGDLGTQREANYMNAQQTMEGQVLDSSTQIEIERAKAQQAKKDRRVGAMGMLVGGGAKIIGSGMGGG